MKTSCFRQKLRRSCIMNMRLKCLLSITTTLVVQVVGNMFLTRAVLSEYHHAHIGSGYQPYTVHDFLKCGTVTGEHRHTALSCLTFFQYGTDQGDKFILHKPVSYTHLHGNLVASGGSYKIVQPFEIYRRQLVYDDRRLQHLSLIHIFRKKALYRVTPDYSISMLHEWRKDGTNI